MSKPVEGLLRAWVGDTIGQAVADKRCIKEPYGCGQQLLKEDGSQRFVFNDREEAYAYEAEWRITGLCPTCQDSADGGPEAA